VNETVTYLNGVFNSRSYFNNTGYIVTITSPEEQAFILRAYPNITFWIGGADYYGIFPSLLSSFFVLFLLIKNNQLVITTACRGLDTSSGWMGQRAILIFMINIPALAFLEYILSLSPLSLYYPFF
jgi:hypothetical protein